MFKVDWYKLVLHNIVSALRERTRVQWLVLLVSEIRKKWDWLVSFREAKLYDANHTGQIIYLEKILNDTFDPTLRRIHIGDGDFKDRVIVGSRTSTLYIWHRWIDGTYYLTPYKVAHPDQNGDLVVWECNHGIGTQAEPSDASPDWDRYDTSQFIKTRDKYNYGIGFIVYVPVSLQYDLNQMKALINFRKVAGRPYKIVEE